MDPHLERLQREIDQAVAGLSAEQLSRHSPGKWCSTEILEHLCLTYTGTIKGFGRVVAAGKPLATTLTWKHRAQSLLVVGFGYLPPGREAPAVARPRGMPPETVRAEIGQKIVEMDQVLTECEAKFGKRIKVLDHPILGPFSIAQWRKFHLVHGRHHLKQIRRLQSDARAA
ncbi:MAG TPA: DUF1569 domain-containing protein [Candidatus Dormibacteraeota bacterium]|nr:DUF1569 domain-containing protein [Candidatus Dormibacteraeota bacterium]